MCSWTNIHLEKYQRLCGTTISIIYKIKSKYCGNSPFLEDRKISLLLHVHQDTEYESCEIYIRISQPIFTQKRTSKYLWDNDIHALQNGGKILWKILIFIDLEPFFYYFLITKTLNLSHKITEIGVSGSILTQGKIKVYMGKPYPSSTRWDIYVL